LLQAHLVSLVPGTSLYSLLRIMKLQITQARHHGGRRGHGPLYYVNPEEGRILKTHRVFDEDLLLIREVPQPNAAYPTDNYEELWITDGTTADTCLLFTSTDWGEIIQPILRANPPPSLSGTGRPQQEARPQDPPKDPWRPGKLEPVPPIQPLQTHPGRRRAPHSQTPVEPKDWEAVENNSPSAAGNVPSCLC
jgi:hypothetical protein